MNETLDKFNEGEKKIYKDFNLINVFCHIYGKEHTKEAKDVIISKISTNLIHDVKKKSFKQGKKLNKLNSIIFPPDE